MLLGREPLCVRERDRELRATVRERRAERKGHVESSDFKELRRGNRSSNSLEKKRQIVRNWWSSWDKRVIKSESLADIETHGKEAEEGLTEQIL